MDGVLELLPSLLDGHRLNQLVSYLDSCDELVAFHGQNKSNETCIKLINSRLNENDSRLEGLLVLKVVLPQCSVETFESNATTWLSHCLKGTFDKNPNVANISFSVLRNLLITAIKFPDIKKYASANIIFKLLEHCKREINVKTIQSLLECLNVCIEEYPGACRESSRYILNLLMRLLDAEPHLLSLAAKCYAQLTQVKGKGKQGISYQSVWKTNQLSLIHTLHHYLDSLFCNVDEIQTAQRPSQSGVELLIGKQLRNNASVSEKMQFLMKNIKGLSKFLQALLLGKYPVSKQILPDVIISLICRGLAVTCNSLGSVTTDVLSLGSVLPEVHRDLLNILIALITCCGRNLIQYGSVICKLLNQELKWTSISEWPYGLDKPYRNLRSTVYNCLHCWLSIAKSASSIDIVVEETVQYLLQDIHMNRPIVTLKAIKTSLNKNQPHYNLSSDSRSDKLSIKLANKGLCLNALKCLQIIIYSSTIYMKSALCKIIQETIISLLFEIQNAHNGYPIPYSCGLCRKELYSTLLALCMEPHPSHPPPINYAIAIFKRGLLDPLSEVNVFCVTSLSNLEKIIHPSAPPLGNTLQYDTVQPQPLIEENVINEPSLSITSPVLIKDMPLSAFPNLNNVIVVKVYDSKNDDRNSAADSNIDGLVDISNECVGKNIEYVKSIQKTTFRLKSSGIDENINLGDIISLNNSLNDDISFVNNNDDSENTNDENVNVSVHNSQNKIDSILLINDVSSPISKHPEKFSLFDKINGLSCNVKDGNIVNGVHDDLKKKGVIRNIIEENILNGVCDDTSKKELSISNVFHNDVKQTSENIPTDVVNGEIGLENGINVNGNNVEDEPPSKKVKISPVEENSLKIVEETSENSLISTETSKVINDMNSTLDEDEMVNCFVDALQE